MTEAELKAISDDLPRVKAHKVRALVAEVYRLRWDLKCIAEGRFTSGADIDDVAEFAKRTLGPGSTTTTEALATAYATTKDRR